MPYPAGGSTDIGARAIADHLSRVFGQQVVVENKSGGSGNVGFDFAAKSAPDGYTVLIAPDQVTSAPHVFKVSFDPLKDFVPVIQLSQQPVVLAANPKLGVSKLAELIALAKQKPGMSYATSGVGSQQHMAAAWFAKLAGIKLEHVPYRGGGQAINDLVAGHMMLASLGSTPLIPHYKAGTLKLLGADARRSVRRACRTCRPIRRPASRIWRSTNGSARLCRREHAPAIVARLNDEMNKALVQAAMRDMFVNSAQDPVGGTPSSSDACARGFRQIRAAVEGPEYQR